MSSTTHTSDPDTLSTGKPVSDDTILKVAKEVIVKFIEVGRLSPSNFDETFHEIYSSVRKAVRS
ncbi:MAG: hypothetical protein KKB30_05625 [Proteobacteria bacterium]|nr:hypothetical protein [Pseudomonadota bacterium]MBU1716179.1 hypothetical protein [Pseudomonadota bacterium]